MSFVFSLELFYICLCGALHIADYAVWALLTVEGRTLTYSWNLFSIIWTLVESCLICNQTTFLFIVVDFYNVAATNAKQSNRTKQSIKANQSNPNKTKQ